jgi:YggT family protein
MIGAEALDKTPILVTWRAGATMLILSLVRGVAFGLFLLSGLVAIGSWALMTRRIDPFGNAGQIIRRITDPVLGPVEHWLRKRGGNPQKAGWWLFGGSVLFGILLITVTEWLLVQSVSLAMAGEAGPRGILRLVTYYAGQVIIFSLIARVIGSWFGVGRHNRFMRVAYLLTDWIVEPLRRIGPRIGMVDITPLVAWLILHFALSFVMGII